MKTQPLFRYLTGVVLFSIGTTGTLNAQHGGGPLNELLAEVRAVRSDLTAVRSELKAQRAALNSVTTTLNQAIAELAPPSKSKTRLLIPFVTTQAGFDTGIAISNTGQDANGVVGSPGQCTFRYFGSLANGNPPSRPVETTNAPIQPGQVVSMVVSSGGSHGLQGNPNFSGYVEIHCDFPFAHGVAFVTDGPIGQGRVAFNSPVLILPVSRGPIVESLGQ